MQRDECHAYVEIHVHLHGCVRNPSELSDEIRAFLIEKLQPDYDSDVEVILDSVTAD